jgi:hypothetical protein
VGFVVQHIPHVIPVLVAFAFLARLGRSLSDQPPARLSDEEIAAWHRAREERLYARRVRASTSRLGLWSLGPLAVAFATGLWLYTEALRNQEPGALLVWIHGVFSVLGLGLISLKLVDLGRTRIARGLQPRRALTDGVSLVLAVVNLPLLVTGVVLLAAPSTGSASAYGHLVASVWWSVLFGAHLFRYIGRALDAALRGKAALEASPAPSVTDGDEQPWSAPARSTTRTSTTS